MGNMDRDKQTNIILHSNIGRAQIRGEQTNKPERVREREREKRERNRNIEREVVEEIKRK